MAKQTLIARLNIISSVTSHLGLHHLTLTLSFTTRTIQGLAKMLDVTCLSTKQHKVNRLKIRTEVLTDVGM